MAEHTPSPWEIKDEFVGSRVITRVIGARYPGAYKPIATLHPGFTRFEEDSRLIVASPDLLECLTEGNEMDTPRFLEAIADRLVDEYCERPNVDFVLALRRKAAKARAAIAKATGGQP